MKRTALRRSLLATCLALLLALGAPEAEAQSPSPVTLTVQPGLGGYCKPDRWFPVRVTLENAGPDLNVQVQAWYRNPWSGRTAYGMDVSLPSGARKEFFLYVFGERWAGKFTISVRNQAETIAEHALNWGCEDENTLLVGLLAETSTPYALLADIRPLTGTSRLVPLRPEELPDWAQGWQALDALVIADADTGALSAAQREALRLWLAEGGKLLVTGGAHWQRSTAGLKEILPLAGETSQPVENLTALRDYFGLESIPPGQAMLITGALQPHAQVLIEQDGLPLLVHRTVGLGEVYALTVDPASQTLRGWEGMTVVYNHLLGARTARPRWMRWPWNEDDTGTALASLPQLGLPSILMVFCWLGVYFLVIGPVNFLILRRIHRPEWAWVTIPALVLAFSAVAYMAGFIYLDTRPTINRLTVVQAWDTAPLARAQARAGIYSPNRARYDVQVQSPFKFLPQGNEAASIQSNNNWLALEQAGGQLLPDAQIEIGGMKSVSVEGSLPGLEIAHDLKVILSTSAPRLSGTFTNQSRMTLKEAFLVTPGSVLQLGDLSPGESVPVRLPLEVNRNRAGFYSSTFILPTYAMKRTQLSLEETRQKGLIRAITDPNDEVLRSNWGIYLMGWLETPLLPVALPKVNAHLLDTTFYIHLLTPELQTEGDTWLLNEAVFAWEGSDDSVSPYSSGYGKLSEGYQLRFRPALPVKFSRVVWLTLNLDASVLPSEVTLEAWNYVAREWRQIPVSNWQSVSLPQPEEFVGPGGEVQIRLKSNLNSWGSMYESSINLLVEP